MHFISAAVLLVATGTLRGVVGSVIQTPANTTVDKPTPDLGINCRGNTYCSYGSSSELQSLICSIDPNTFYNNGQQIACDTNICAFLQNSNGANAGTLCTLAGDIVSHGCKVCGSVPTGYPGSNDVSQGELTFNYASHTCNFGGTTVC